MSAMATKMTATCTWHYICWKVLSQTKMIFKNELILEMDQADKNFEYIFYLQINNQLIMAFKVKVAI